MSEDKRIWYIKMVIFRDSWPLKITQSKNKTFLWHDHFFLFLFFFLQFLDVFFILSVNRDILKIIIPLTFITIEFMKDNNTP